MVTFPMRSQQTSTGVGDAQLGSAHHPPELHIRKHLAYLVFLWLCYSWQKVLHQQWFVAYCKTIRNSEISGIPDISEIAKELKCDDKKALEYLKKLKEDKRYLLDVY